MEKTILVLPEGREISSGVTGEAAIVSCSLTRQVNSGQELLPGAVCAAMAEIKLVAPEGDVSIHAGDRLEIYRESENGRRKVGIFYAEKPTKTGRFTMNLVAYDSVCRLDRDMTEFVNGLTGWPYRLYDFADTVCRVCGLELRDPQLPQGDLLIEKFAVSAVTGRRLLQWAAQAAGCFCRADPEGQLEFAWYAPRGLLVGRDGEVFSYEKGVLTVDDPTVTAEFAAGNLSLQTLWAVEGENITAERTYAFQGLRREDYAVLPVQKVWVDQTDQDMGAIYPDDPAAENTVKITGNPLLAGLSQAALEQVAKALYERLSAVSYTPCQVSLPATASVEAGDIFHVVSGGERLTVYAMSVKRTGNLLTVTATGSHRRDASGAVNDASYQALSGKVMNLQLDMDGLRAENKAADGRVGSLELTVDGIATQVEKQTAEGASLQKEMTTLRQSAQSLQIDVRTIREEGVSKVQTGMGYTFDDGGLRIAREGQQMVNLLDNTGMYVARSGQPVLQAGIDGVIATDVQVRNYLTVGHSRLETYETSRTACFYIG